MHQSRCYQPPESGRGVYRGFDQDDLIGENAETDKENSVDLTRRVVSAVSSPMQGFMKEVSGTMLSIENVLQGLVARAQSPSLGNTPAGESRDSVIETRRRNRDVHSTRTRMSWDTKYKADDTMSSSDGRDVEIEGYSSGISCSSLNMGQATSFRAARSHSVRLPALQGKNQGTYGSIEATKTYAGQFSRRKQKPGELAEEYAAELKRLYDKAHPNRDTMTGREDLLRRFLDGLYDDRARFQEEDVKEPNDIDEAVYHVTFMQSKTCPNVHESLQDRTFKKMTRRTTQQGVESDIDDHYELVEEDEYKTREHVYRVPVKNDGVKKTQNTVKGGPITLNTRKEDKTESEKSNENKSQDKEILQQIVDKIKKLKMG
ncbi:hypothetical protein CHS0354_038868 [Potamilus streckersoni]|uniref:Uncharacterized protein n=1 Tax=Potamilus streckersoni TaxID=2493646 RepID=A0AAE0SBS4_9BIVA|nr:hypothetical protein CHS0354_038868 [Potamilus streckersoni]